MMRAVKHAITRTFAGVIDVQDVGAGNRVHVERHDRICESVTLIGLDPWLDTAAAGSTCKCKKKQQKSTECSDFHVHTSTLS